MADSIFRDALVRLQKYGESADVSPDVVKSLMHPLSIIKATLPVRMDDGSTEYFTGYRCRYNNTLGPTKGGVTVSYFEWVQNRQGLKWSLKEVHDRLEKIIVGAFDTVWNLSQERKLSMRNAAYAVAIGRIGEAVEAHGTRDYFNN